MKHQKTFNCQDILQYLNDYVDEGLDQELFAGFEAHINACSDCKIVLNTLKKTIQLYHSSGQETPLPEDVQKRLYARLDLDSHDRKQ